MRTKGNGSRDNRDYVLTHTWLGDWESACPGCGEEAKGSLAKVFALLWKHRNCMGDEG
jgi:hypothetical protein